MIIYLNMAQIKNIFHYIVDVYYLMFLLIHLKILYIKIYLIKNKI